MRTIPPQLRQRIERLREAVNTIAHQPGGSSFGPVFDLFMDLAEDPDFRAIGETDDTAWFLPTLEMLARTLVVRPPAVFSGIAAAKVPELGLRHGAVTVNGNPGGYFTFEGDERGMFGFSRPDGQFQMMRFTLTRPPPGLAPGQLVNPVRGVQ